MKERKLLDLAMARGFDRIASHWYRPNSSDPQGLAYWARASLRQDVSAYRFEKEFATDDGQLVIVRFYKR